MKRHPLENLLMNNKGRGFFRAEVTGAEATVFLYDVIVSDDYWGGVSALSFAKEMAAIVAPVIHLRIDSPGGDVFASVAMAQAIREHASKVIVHVDGYAASAATQLLMAADESVISPGGMVMIHKAWSGAYGNSDDFTALAGLLVKIDGQIAASYAAKTGLETEDLLVMMAAETWMTETEAIDAGFVDALAEGNPNKQNQVRWDLSAYKKAPAAKGPADPPPAAEPPDDNDTDGADPGAVSVSDAQAHANRLRELELIEGAA
jgi:ATP-dependent Clp protease protease subunit